MPVSVVYKENNIKNISVQKWNMFLQALVLCAEFNISYFYEFCIKYITSN